MSGSPIEDTLALPGQDSDNCRQEPAPSAAGSLLRALEYRNEAIVYKFLERFDMSVGEAEALFEETKKWLWLCSIAERPHLVITHELFILDEMWHTFILFTNEYADYCNRYLGGFVHHAPMTRAEKEAQQREYREDPDGFSARRDEAMRLEYELIADHLGQDTLFTWFVEYPRRYGSEFFRRAVKPSGPHLEDELIRRLHDIADQYVGDESSSPAGHQAGDNP